MFDGLKELGEMRKKAEAFKALVDEFLHVDANKNGVPDGHEIAAGLLELRDLFLEEEGKVGDALEEAKEKISEKTREIIRLAGDDVEALKPHLEKLAKALK